MSGPRLRDACLCLAESHGTALEILLGRRPVDRGAVKCSASGRWAYQTVRDGFLFEDRETWGGWYSRPAGSVGWDEFDRLIGADPRVEEIRRWADGLTVPDSWRDLTRPAELVPGDCMHPHFQEEEHARPGWDERWHAWGLTLDVLLEAADRAPVEPEQLDMLAYLEQLS